uniref:N(4)-(Beta-N-acetylglucosaminyl)-L-asparaginase n=1 Tax=Ciona savignyi TaxID=51511 RepID=H2Z8A4_CIOSA
MLCCIYIFSVIVMSHAQLPIVVNTWPWPQATEAAWDKLISSSSVLDAVETGCTQCEIDQCGGSVGFGGSPDENGETTLDAMIMDGGNMNIGAVGCVRGIKNAIGVARRVLENTEHTLLVGNLAKDFAVEMGFKEESLSTNHSQQMYNDWRKSNCQPNYRSNVTPNPKTSCGPYKPMRSHVQAEQNSRANLNINQSNHDTVGMISIDENGHVAAGTSTNGLNHKVPGRVGDSPIPGAGCYADNTVGGAVATGDGDVMMRFLPSFQVIESMRHGVSPTQAIEDALNRILKYYPTFNGALVAVSKDGYVGAACTGFSSFHYCVRSHSHQPTAVFSVKCK